MASDDEGAEDAQADPYFEKFAGPLGHVILEFNYLEVDAGRMIARLLKQDDVTAGVFAGLLPFMEKLKLIQALAAFKVPDEEMKAEFERIVKDATAVNGKRNRFVHAEYMPVIGPTDELMKMLHRRLKDAARMEHTDGRGFHALLQPVDAGELAALANDIHALAYRMRVLAEKFADWNP